MLIKTTPLFFGSRSWKGTAVRELRVPSIVLEQLWIRGEDLPLLTKVIHVPRSHICPISSQQQTILLIQGVLATCHQFCSEPMACGCDLERREAPKTENEREMSTAESIPGLPSFHYRTCSNAMFRRAEALISSETKRQHNGDWVVLWLGKRIMSRQLRQRTADSKIQIFPSIS